MNITDNNKEIFAFGVPIGKYEFTDVLYGLQKLQEVSPGPIEGKVNKVGYFPGVGQVVAIGRALFGVVKVVALVGQAIFSTLFPVVVSKPDKGFKHEFVDAFKHIGRAAVEIVPVVGGIAAYQYDQWRFKSVFFGAIREMAKLHSTSNY